MKTPMQNQELEQYKYHLHLLIRRLYRLVPGLTRGLALETAHSEVLMFLEEMRLRDLPKPTITITNKLEGKPDLYQVLVEPDSLHWSYDLLDELYPTAFCIMTIEFPGT